MFPFSGKAIFGTTALSLSLSLSFILSFNCRQSVRFRGTMYKVILHEVPQISCRFPIFVSCPYILRGSLIWNTLKNYWQRHILKFAIFVYLTKETKLNYKGQ